MQHYSEVLAWMFDETQGSDDDAIRLDDPLEAFRDLVAMLLKYVNIHCDYESSQNSQRHRP